MKVKDIMKPDPLCCSPSDTVESAARKMKEKDVGSLPVIADSESRKLEGIVTDRDLCCNVIAEGKDPGTTFVVEAMTRYPATCGPDDDVDTCAKIMQDHQVRRVPVVSCEGSVIGVVAQADMALRAKPKEVAKTVAEISKPSPAKAPAQAAAQLAS